MALRMHPVPAARWAQLAETRRPIDITEEPTDAAPPGKGARLRTEHARIQKQVDALAARRISATR